jgi:hypothetical protein
LTQTWLEQVNANRAFRDLVDFFASTESFHLVPEMVRSPESALGRANGRLQNGLLERIATTPPQTRRARLRRVLEAVRAAVPQRMRGLVSMRCFSFCPAVRGHACSPRVTLRTSGHSSQQDLAWLKRPCRGRGRETSNV